MATITTSDEAVVLRAQIVTNLSDQCIELPVVIVNPEINSSRYKNPKRGKKMKSGCGPFSIATYESRAKHNSIPGRHGLFITGVECLQLLWRLKIVAGRGVQPA